MKITKISITKAKRGSGALEAIAEVTFDSAFTVRGIRVMYGKFKSLFIVLPRFSNSTQHIFFPENREFEQYISDSIINECLALELRNV